MTRLEIRHVTVYRYARPVSFGEHRAMLRPRDSHDLKLIETSLIVSPKATVRWVHDVFGNSITVLAFEKAAAALRVESRILLQHYAPSEPDYPIAADAELWPFVYGDEERRDLGPTLDRHYPDPEDRVRAWTMSFTQGGETRTLPLLGAMTRGIKEQLRYQERHEKGTQAPLETLEKGGGSCRDYALLMIEAARSLGFAARFVTGYLYDPTLDGAAEAAMTGAGATHAWVQVYLPGAGWVEFDPTNGIVGGRNLIRVAVARDPKQAVPLAGSYVGRPEDYLGMTVEVQVARSDGGSSAQAGSGGSNR
jgi:transglutaminase-like putative cysteine protease